MLAIVYWSIALLWYAIGLTWVARAHGRSHVDDFAGWSAIVTLCALAWPIGFLVLVPVMVFWWRAGR